MMIEYIEDKNEKKFCVKQNIYCKHANNYGYCHIDGCTSLSSTDGVILTDIEGKVPPKTLNINGYKYIRKEKI